MKEGKEDLSEVRIIAELRGPFYEVVMTLAFIPSETESTGGFE